MDKKENCPQTKNPTRRVSCDKGGHKERSLAHQPNHRNHWSKEAKKTTK